MKIKIWAVRLLSPAKMKLSHLPARAAVLTIASLLLLIFQTDARAGLSSLEVSHVYEQAVDQSAVFPENLAAENTVNWTMGVTRGRYLMKGVDAAGNPIEVGMEVKPYAYEGESIAPGTDTLLIGRTENSQTVSDPGTVTLGVLAADTFSLEVKFSFFQASGGHCDFTVPRNIQLMISSFDLDFEQGYSFPTEDFLSFQMERTTTLTRTTDGPWTKFTGAAAGTIPSDSKAGVYAITDGGSSFRLRLQHRNAAIFLLEFRTDSKIAPPDDPDVTVLQPVARYGDRVWLDADGNGQQSASENGVDGILLDFFRDNGDGIPDPLRDEYVDTVLTATRNGVTGSYGFDTTVAGRYFALVRAPDSYGYTRPDAGNDAGDSDALAILYKARRAAILPLVSLNPGTDNLTMDAGLTDRSGIPAVWAMVEQADGKILLGGRFATSHGVARKNIARVLADGSLDTAFDPGSGFDGPVRSLSVLENGRIIAGGDFRNYNGQPATGVAVLSPKGVLLTGMPQTDQPMVRWVGAAGGKIYVGGEFTSIGGMAARNFARLKATKSGKGGDEKLEPDEEMDAAEGTNGTVFDGLVGEGGRVILVGAFTAYAGQSAGRICALAPSGKIDKKFNAGTGANGDIYSILRMEDGRIVLSGAFTTFNGIPCNGAVRLQTDGTVDPTFRRSALAVDAITTSN